jgi:uncharacterized MAPEG superfamily protein
MNLLQIYALTAIVLALKMFAISLAQGKARVAANKFVNPEDAVTFKGQAAEEDAPDVLRASRAWRNDLENIPIFLILAGIYVDAGLSTGAFAIYCGIFVVCRIVHTIAYLKSIQPLRTIIFTIGLLAMLAMIMHLLIAVVIA